MDRPTIFLSSTVHDFADLRSALKDYLELRGCRVLASEYTDFTRPLDKHSYDACLAAIEQADLFVLFIGRRVGGWYDEPAKVSITRAEYRHAYKLAKAGRIRLLCFVRSDVWNHRQSVRDLTTTLKEDASLTDEQRRKLANHPTLAMENAEAIIALIDEITKNVATAKASKGRGTAPIANWLMPFQTFAEIRQALDPLILQGLSVREGAGRRALEVQLNLLLRNVLPRIGDGLLNPINSVLNLRTAIGLTTEQLGKKIRVDEKTWSRLATLIMFATPAEADSAPLQTALGSDLLLRYDPAKGTYERTQEYDLLAVVVEQCRALQRCPVNMPELFGYGQAINSTGDRLVPAPLLIEALHRLLRWVELIGSARALARSLGGGDFRPPVAIPRTPIVDQEEAVAKEAVSLDEVAAFVEEWGNET